MPAPSVTQVVRAMIHPAIGVARVGNAADEYFIGPQVIDPPPLPPGAHRDATGALKRQAAQFRIYGYNQAGQVVAELTAETADITWSVHVANRKAAWYQWQLAMDIPEAATVTPPLRNASVTDRQSLVIDAGMRSISGANAAPVSCGGTFTGVPVALGELRTDAHGRLLFLGGHGISASPSGTPIYLPANNNSFINADGWYDDTCDGPVGATVSINGRSIPVDSAWVVSAPPNYAPHLKAFRTMYDLMLDMYLQAGWLAPPAEISFTKHVYPILRRLTDLQWVNQGFAAQFGYDSPHDFTDRAFVARLAEKSAPGAYDPHAERRLQLLNNFRLADPQGSSTLHWPWIYGDAMGEPPFEGPRHNAAITQTQYSILQLWAAGEFISDWDSSVMPPASIHDVPLAEQPATLDRAALEFCIADVFHPGCEMTFPMRHLTMYSQPFRIRARPDGVPPQAYGANLTQAAVIAANGPLQAQGPGELTRWMGLPWQADTSYCRAGYTPAYDPFLPSFWPARVPNQVLSEVDYATVTDMTQPMEVRLRAFHDRTNWNQPLSGPMGSPSPDTATQMADMVRIFGSMGVVEVRPGPTDTPAFPATMMVASYGPDIPRSEEVSAPDTVAAAVVAAAPPVTAAPPAAPAPAPAATVLHQAAVKKPKIPRGANFKSEEEARNAPRSTQHRRG